MLLTFLIIDHLGYLRIFSEMNDPRLKYKFGTWKTSGEKEKVDKDLPDFTEAEKNHLSFSSSRNNEKIEFPRKHEKIKTAFPDFLIKEQKKINSSPKDTEKTGFSLKEKLDLPDARKKIQILIHNPKESNHALGKESKTAKLFKKRRLSIFQRPTEEQTTLIVGSNDESDFDSQRTIPVLDSIKSEFVDSEVTKIASQNTDKSNNISGVSFLDMTESSIDLESTVITISSGGSPLKSPCLENICEEIIQPARKLRNRTVTPTIETSSVKRRRQCAIGIVYNENEKRSASPQKKISKKSNDNSVNEIPKHVPEEIETIFYKIVCNIGYAFVKIGADNVIWYKCFIAGCKFKFMNLNQFEKHIGQFHSDVTWNGFCNACEKVITCFNTKSIETELVHFKMEHVDKEIINANNNEVQQPMKTASNADDKKKEEGSAKQIKNNRQLSPTSSGFKHMNIERFFKNMQPINLRPWLTSYYSKENAAAAMMLTQNTLAALFKCMFKRCTFYSSSKEIFEKHLKLHQPNLDVMICSYCSFYSASIDSFLGHIEREHKNDIFQCCFCFYRSLNPQNLYTHISHYHPNHAHTIIETLPHKELVAAENAVKNAACSFENVMHAAQKFECFVCKQFFFFYADFEMHIQTHAEGSKECHVCYKTIDVKDSLAHSLDCLKRGKHQCLFCTFGCNSFKDINLHLADLHPSKVPYFCDRSACPDGVIFFVLTIIIY